MIDSNNLINKSDAFQTSTDTVKIALNILGALNALFVSGTNEERNTIKKILQLAWERL